MKLCLCIMRANKTHNIAPKLDDQGKPRTDIDPEAGRHRRGEVIDIFDADTRGGFSGSGGPAFFNIYITGWAVRAGETNEDALRRAKEWLLVPHEHDTEWSVTPIAPGLPGEREGIKRGVARKRRLIHIPSLTPAARQALRDDGHITRTAAWLRNNIKRRKANIRGDDDVEADDAVNP